MGFKHRWQCIKTTLFLAALWMTRGVQGQDLGAWQVLLNNAGIASMHTAVTHYNTLVLLDRTDIGPSQIALPGEYFSILHCRRKIGISGLKRGKAYLEYNTLLDAQTGLEKQTDAKGHDDAKYYSGSVEGRSRSCLHLLGFLK